MPTDASAPHSLTAGRRLILGLLAPHWRLGVAGVVAGLLWAGGRVATPLIVSWIVGQSLATQEVRPLLAGAALLLVVAVLTAVAAGVRRFVGESLGAQVDADLRTQLFDKMQRLHLGVYERIPVGEMLNRTSTDIQQIRHPIVNGPYTIANLVLVTASVVVLVSLDPLLALLTVLPSLAVLPLTARMVHRLERAASRLHDALSDASVAIQEGLAGLRTIKGLGTERREIERVAERSLGVEEAAREVISVRATFLPLTDVLPTLGMVAVVWAGGMAVSGGTLSLETLVAFSYFVTMLVGPLRTIGMTAAQFQRASLSASLVASILDLPSDAEASRVAAAEQSLARNSGYGSPIGPPRLAFHDVTFGYTPEEVVLRGFSLDVAPGETVALVGRTGAGKSTVLWLASRLYDPSEGRVTLDGVDIREVPSSELRKRVSIQSGEAFLFEGAISENIRFGRPDATMDEVLWAAGVAGVDAFVRHLAAGYDTVVAARGRSLSGGQRQRIALARVVLMEAGLLLLDEPLSAVDAEMEGEVRSALAEVLGPRTCLIVAHRPSTLALADRILLIDKGKVIDSGTHADLVQRSEDYRTALALSAYRGRDAASGAWSVTP